MFTISLEKIYEKMKKRNFQIATCYEIKNKLYYNNHIGINFRVMLTSARTLVKNTKMVIFTLKITFFFIL
jgi:hypothetical protein